MVSAKHLQGRRRHCPQSVRPAIISFAATAGVREAHVLVRDVHANMALRTHMWMLKPAP